MKIVPLGALFLLHGAALFLAVQTLGRLSQTAPVGYVPWLLLLGFGVGAFLVLKRLRPVPTCLALAIWTLVVQLVLLPPWFSTAFRMVSFAPVLIVTALSLPEAYGPILALVELIFFLVSQGSRTAWGLAVPAPVGEELWSQGAVGAILVVGAWSLKTSFRKRERAEAELASLKEGVQQIVQANVGFQEMATAIEQTSIRKERLRITREIHDVVGYTLTNQTMFLQAAVVLLDKDREKLRELLFSAQDSARSGLQEVRQALRQLRIVSERPQAFLNRLNQLCRTFEQATQVKVDLSGAQAPADLPAPLELVLYRLVQEGLTNAFLHGKATRVSIGLALDDFGLTVHLLDNGTGADQVAEGIGLEGMRERLEPFGGTFEYGGGSHGFTIVAWIPRASLKEDS